MAETVVDEAGLARTPTGDLAPTQETTPSETKSPETKPPTSTSTSTSAEVKDESLLGKGKDEPKAPAGAPEKYDAFTLPEGFEANEEMLNEASALFKAMNLPQGEAQKLVDFYAKQSQQASNAPIEYWQQMQDEWRGEVVKDKDLGTGTELKPAVRESLGRMIGSLGALAEPFRDAMAMTGAGNHPAVIRALNALAQQVTEGKHVAGLGPSAEGQQRTGQVERPTAARALYPNLP